MDDEEWRKSVENRLVFAMLAGPWAYVAVLASTGQDFFDAMAGGGFRGSDGPAGALGTSAAFMGKAFHDTYMAAVEETEWEKVQEDIDKMLRSLNPLYRNVRQVQENFWE